MQGTENSCPLGINLLSCFGAKFKKSPIGKAVIQTKRADGLLKGEI